MINWLVSHKQQGRNRGNSKEHDLEDELDKVADRGLGRIGFNPSK